MTRCLELKPPIVTDDVAKRSRRTHVILRPKEEVDGFLRVERTRFGLGGLGALLPVCPNIVEVVDGREEGVHMAGKFKRKRVFGGRDAREGIRSVVADYLSRHRLVRPIGQLSEHRYIMVRSARRAADGNVLNVNHERAR